MLDDDDNDYDDDDDSDDDDDEICRRITLMGFPPSADHILLLLRLCKELFSYRQRPTPFLGKPSKQSQHWDSLTNL